MGPSFLPRLVNGPFDDPGLFVPFRHAKRALLFDLGDISSLSAREILKISHIFVTHTHMDHFCGFDHVLRLMLGRDKELSLYGPQGFLDNVRGKLAGYCWNLVENYTNRFVLHVTEIHPEQVTTSCFVCHEGFAEQKDRATAPFDGIVLDEPTLQVRAVHLDHGTPVLAFALAERFHVQILPTALEALGLVPGAWLSNFKSMMYEGSRDETIIEAPLAAPAGGTRAFSLGSLKADIARVTEGQRLAYVADVTGTSANLEKIQRLAHGVDHLFVEAAFSHADRKVALDKHHLTAGQAGLLARRCRARQYSLFHFSPRYSDCPGILEAEARQAFAGQLSAAAQDEAAIPTFSGGS